MTPEVAEITYASMSANLEVVRQRLGRALTLSEKALLGHLDDAGHQELVPQTSYLLLRPDRVVLPDVLGQTAMLQFIQTGRDTVAVATSVHCDHLIQARTGAESDLRASIAENREIYDFMRSAAARYGAAFWPPGAGIIHQVVLEQYAFPGQLIIGTDSHTPNAGGLGACAIGVGGAEAAEALAGLPLELLYPKRIAIYLTGALRGWTAPKDIILYVAGELSVAGGTNAVVEYIGPGARTLSATGKATICNMGAELGATTSMFPADPRMSAYLRATGRGELRPLVDKYRHLLEPDAEVEADPGAYYDQVIRLDLSVLEPYIAGPHTPDRVRPISQLAEELGRDASLAPERISTALIGSCTNSSYEDMSRAADVAAQARTHGVKAAVALLVTPGSEQIRATIERDGQMAALQSIGAVVLANACGPCIGQWRRDREAAGVPNTIVTSYNRNFPARNDGHATTHNFIGSPELVTALALAGRLTFNPLRDALIGADGKPFHLEPPRPAPEVPPTTFARGAISRIEPPADRGNIRLELDPKSERLQLLERWPAWDGGDCLDMPVLVKAKGKTTTDQLSPAGPWMRYRGHIDKSSDSMFMGVVNAYTGEVGAGTNVLTQEPAQPLSKTARHYKERGVRWVVIGDVNYGEGSSREHAALQPRHLGGAAVIARSFARIHESNLKKQGLLALTFDDPADYERVREGDRISLVGLAGMKPGAPIECRLNRADGSFEMINLRHTYSASQIEWFRAGSALNLSRGP
ncbi:MAG TPA: aconitate hydratase [Burkholderiales bacterium]|nr:aconitate hydratase [Burkholderiales bacterium]